MKQKPAKAKYYYCHGEAYLAKRKTPYGSSNLLKSIKLKQMQATNTAQNLRECCCWNGSLSSGGRFNLCPHTGALAAEAAVSCPSQTQGLQPQAEAGSIGKKGARRLAEHSHLS